VAEDEEYIEDYDDLSILEESEEFEQSNDTLNESGEVGDSSYEQTREACIITNFLKASLIVSGGEGFLNLNLPDSLPEEQSTLIMWQQNTT